MQHSEQNQGPGAFGIAKILSEHICLVYHAETGDILHTHRTVNLVGSKSREIREIEAHAVNLAMRAGQKRDRAQMKTLLVGLGELVPSGRYKVDVQHNKLVLETKATDEK